MNILKNLLFLWDDRFQTEENQGIILSGAYKISYIQTRNRLTIQKNTDYLESFWGGSIWDQALDCFAIVGDNGIGKTRLMNLILDDLRCFTNGEKTEPCIMIFEGTDHEEQERLFVFYSQELEKPKIDAERELLFEYLPASPDRRSGCGRISAKTALKNMKTAYFHHSLSLHDFENPQKCSYDFSLGGLLSSHSQMDHEMRYNGLDKNPIRTYYDRELYKIVHLLYNYHPEEAPELEIPIPKYIQIGAADVSYLEKYIFRELRKHMVSGPPDADERLKQMKGIFQKLPGLFRHSWSAYIVRAVLLGCIREACIPSVVPSPSRVDLERLTAGDLLSEDCAERYGLFGYAKKFLEELGRALMGHSLIAILVIQQTRDFISWLEENESVIRKLENKGKPELSIIPGQESRLFMEKLLFHYEELSYAFPFLSFSFGTSSGENALLSLWADLYGIWEDLKKGSSRTSGQASDCNTLLLILDEADLSLHPRWQRMYMKWLTSFCRRYFLPVINIKLIVTTHSPIILSDFPPNSVCYLRKDEDGHISSRIGGIQTFGNHIHTLYMDSFFLDECGTMGAFAQEKLGAIAELLLKQRNGHNEISDIKTVISYVGEGLLREKLEHALEESNEGINYTMKKTRQTDPALSSALQRLKAQRRELDQTIRELEEMINDPDMDF
ncbi:MAG: AAA family ATPase [Enterocloster sp.]